MVWFYNHSYYVLAIAKFENWPESLEIFEHYKIVKSDNDEKIETACLFEPT